MKLIATNPLRLCLVALVGGAALHADRGPAPPEGWTDSFLIANGIRIHYWRTGGDKPPLVMLHGSGDDGLAWTAVATELEAQYDIVLPDARGHGLSDPVSPDDPADVQSEDLAALIRALRLENPIVVGHSMGASSAAWFAAKYPEVPRAVVLEDPRSLPRPASSYPSGETVRDRILVRNNSSFDELVRECVERFPKWDLQECRIWAPSKRLHHPSNSYRYPLYQERPPMADLFARITAPALVVKADAEAADRAVDVEVANNLQRGRIVHIDGAGHHVRRDQKDAFLAVLRQFLAAL